MNFFLFFSPNFDIKWKSKHSFFVCFQQRLLKLKYYDELKKSKILSILIFHIASFLKEKNNACRRESCFFYRNHLLEQKSAFLRRRNMNFFQTGISNCSLTKWRRYSLVLEQKQVWELLKTSAIVLKKVKLEFLSKNGQMLGLMISSVSVRIRKFFNHKKHWTT